MGKHSLKDFNPERVAVLDTQMWRAYYAHNFLLLMKLLISLFKEQFKADTFTALRLGYYSTQAARHFRKTGNMPRAEHYLRKYYKLLNKHTLEDFDIALAAKTELEWWIIHRYPTRGLLTEALASNMAALYSMPQSKFINYAKERATAMELRDTAAHKERREPDWKAITSHLEKSYTELLRAVTTSK